MTSTRLIGRTLTGALLVAVLPLAAACTSGGTSTETTATSSPTSTTTMSSSPATETSTGQTAAGENSAYCDALKEGTAALEQVPGTINDPEAAKQALAILQKVEAAAPEEVKGAWSDLVAFAEAASTGDSNAVAAAAAKLQTSMTDIETHAKTECGITLS